jgi:opacity protein-like surface antigen
MNKSILALAFALIAVSTAVAQTTAERLRLSGYVQPSAVIAFPGDFDTAAGAALTFGATINEVHAVEAEVIWFESEDGGTRVRFIPVLASYKYTLPIAPNWELRAGGSVGFTHEKAEGRWIWAGSDTAFTYGISGGASYAITKNISLDADALVLGLDNTKFTTEGSIVLVTIGVNFGF